MAIVVGADLKGTRLKDVVKNFLVEEGFEVIDVTKDGQDFVDVTLAVASEVNKDEQNLGIVIDAYGAGPFMVATKIKGMVAAEVSDERSAYMTRGHNNSRMITAVSYTHLDVYKRQPLYRVKDLLHVYSL